MINAASKYVMYLGAFIFSRIFQGSVCIRQCPAFQGIEIPHWHSILPVIVQWAISPSKNMTFGLVLANLVLIIYFRIYYIWYIPKVSEGGTSMADIPSIHPGTILHKSTFKLPLVL